MPTQFPLTISEASQDTSFHFLLSSLGSFYPLRPLPFRSITAHSMQLYRVPENRPASASLAGTIICCYLSLDQYIIII